MSKKSNGKKKNGSDDPKPSRGSDGRMYFTVYVTPEQHEALQKYCKPLGVGVSTFMRQEALRAASVK